MCETRASPNIPKVRFAQRPLDLLLFGHIAILIMANHPSSNVHRTTKWCHHVSSLKLRFKSRWQSELKFLFLFFELLFLGFLRFFLLHHFHQFGEARQTHHLGQRINEEKRLERNVLKAFPLTLSTSLIQIPDGLLWNKGRSLPFLSPHAGGHCNLGMIELMYSPKALLSEVDHLDPSDIPHFGDV